MRRYSIKNYANHVVRRKMCLCGDWCDTLLDVATPNITSLNSVVFDDDDNRYNTIRNIKHVSKSAEFIMLDIRIDCNRKRSLRNLV